MTHRLPAIGQRIVARGVEGLQPPGGIVGVATATGNHGGGRVQLVLETMERRWPLVQLRHNASG